MFTIFSTFQVMDSLTTDGFLIVQLVQEPTQ